MQFIDKVGKIFRTILLSTIQISYSKNNIVKLAHFVNFRNKISQNFVAIFSKMSLFNDIVFQI